mmetsp:Transcript_2004/g.2495  ORF Transcript_2004/g.2495 Transcript_2004/m.2495 type:complete len:155 (-) Transcript_2004:176-640(-)|eukprot:jgi/Bigna1/90725/estExt_fgenesh1_pg.C_770106
MSQEKETEDSKTKKLDPLVAYNSEKVLGGEKFILRRKRGRISPPRGGFNKDDENQQLIEVPEEDEDSDSSTSDPSEDLEQEFFDSLNPEDAKMLLRRLKVEERKKKKAKKEAKKAKKLAKNAKKDAKKKKKKKKNERGSRDRSKRKRPKKYDKR